MNIKNFLKTALGFTLTAMTLASCVQEDEWNTPVIECNNKFDAANISMADFAAQVPSTGFLLIETDQIFDAYVISSDEQGNFYKTLSFQDSPVNPTVGLQIEIDRSNNYIDMPVGSHIRINAKGLRLGIDRGVVKLGAVDPTYAIGRVPASVISRYVSGVCNGNQLDIQAITPTALSSLTEAKQAKYINTLVTVPNVQFTITELFPTQKKYIDYDTSGAGVDTDRNIEDNLGGTTVIRNSGFFKQAGELLPKGSGNITFVVSRYNSTWQMLIRDLDDVQIPATGTRFDPTAPKGGTALTYSGSFVENFESYLYSSSPYLETFPKYINDAVLGNRYWQLRTFSNNKYIQLGANSGSGPYQTYFIVPVDFTAANSLTFKVNVGFYNGAALKVYTSTDYAPLGDVTAATLTDITSSFTVPTIPTNTYGVLGSAGTYNFPAGLTGNGYVLFKYEGAGNGVTTTIQLDDITVQ